jgi:hypothetical protein
MNFYEIAKQAHVINEEKSFINAGIVATAKAVKEGYKIGFLTARASLANHKPLIRRIINMTALKMSDKIEDYQENLKKARAAFVPEFYFFTNDPEDMKKKLSEYMLPGMKQDDGFFGNSKVRVGNDEKKAYVLRLLSDIFQAKLKFFDDESKNLVTAKKLQEKYGNIKSYDIAEFDQTKLKENTSKPNKIFLFDIDGTLIDAEATIWIKKADGKREGISQEAFATGRFKMELGDTLDFKEFSDREHLIKLSKEFSSIIMKKMIEKFSSTELDVSKAKIEDDTFTGILKNKKISVRKMPDNSYLVDYDGTVSKSSNFIGLLRNIKKYFSKVANESISSFSEARLLKLGLKRINKQNNDIYRFKNYSLYLNHFDEDHNFAFVKEKYGRDDYFYLLTERQLNNFDLQSANKVLNYMEQHKNKLVKYESLKDMVIWLRDNRQLPINESYFRDIMILED